MDGHIVTRNEQLTRLSGVLSRLDPVAGTVLRSLASETEYASEEVIEKVIAAITRITVAITRSTAGLQGLQYET